SSSLLLSLLSSSLSSLLLLLLLLLSSSLLLLHYHHYKHALKKRPPCRWECHSVNVNDVTVDGILVQLPLPKQINEQKIISLINPSKDVDGFHPINMGKLVLGESSFIPATPYGIMLMLEHYNINTSGKHAVVIGRSNIVGRPMSILLSQQKQYANCTVTLCHSRTENLAFYCKQADIIVAALGIPGFLKADMIKPGAIVIDVGITRVEDFSKKSGFSIKGDVDFDNVATLCSYITPVPGGVGLMTITALLKNTYNAYLQRNSL
ncbi:MAG: bifunctional 5,10-methylenetetrahydrofolate dehydrogenase/5,10-methenyltetrahydrofolate cyclohydrolase, partial [Flavobacteriia bacterium]|nr:bifunctional 5,10-methylenetetrahydrofolate dehydrogenase/5,10-methenyltetrahydrofolate cyclohydrolase [Flavobacteriia bacterium]